MLTVIILEEVEMIFECNIEVTVKLCELLEKQDYKPPAHACARTPMKKMNEIPSGSQRDEWDPGGMSNPTGISV